ncbi:transposase [Streptomyces pseudovenezuelae]|uniref:Transposase n=1 Tax=Streptomyces pseudovenezuelae TaxID=67350 RepID=A0ABT6M0D5_9ACTN|nr:transposase [Streptomyces pseudovenezuelae]
MSVPMATSQQRKPYLSDLSDARWALMEPTLTSWRAERQKTSLNLGGKVTDLREVMNAILFLNRTGVPWRYLPHDFPPHTTVFGYFSAWTADGTIEKLGLHLHRKVREQEGRTAEPTACVLDAQSVKTAPSVPTDTQGTDAGKKTSDAENVSSGEGETGVFRGREGYGLVERDAVSQAVVEAADHSVEEVPLGGRVSISCLTSAVVVSPRPI